MSVRRRQHVSASTYVDGNTVRKVQRTVEIRPERDEREEYRHKHAVRRNQEKALYMNGPYVLALTIAALITLVLCMNYLHKQASITTRINHIEDLELKLENLKSENVCKLVRRKICFNSAANKLYAVEIRVSGVIAVIAPDSDIFNLSVFLFFKLHDGVLPFVCER